MLKTRSHQDRFILRRAGRGTLQTCALSLTLVLFAAACGGTAASDEEPTGRAAVLRTSPDVHFVDLSTGVTLEYVEQGDPSGVPVLFLHGLSDSWHSYERVLPHLPETIRAFALTQRGHGDSSRPEEGYRYADYAADVAAFMDAFELESGVIVGHSFGSAVAQRFAIDYPDRTLALVLAGSQASWPDNPGVQQLWNGVLSKLEDPVDPGFVREFQTGTLAKPVPDWFLETVVQQSLKVPARVWKATAAGIVEEDLSGELDQIGAPTLIIWGDQDGLIPRSEQEAQLEAIPSARLVVYEGSGHGLHWEEPERFASDVASFVAEQARWPR